MVNMKLWAEAVDIAKDQLRHGKVHYSDLQKATQVIYNDLLEMERGPVWDVKEIVNQEPQTALPAAQEVKFKHEVVDGQVRCAICGKLFTSLNMKHLSSHGFSSKEEYMNRVGVSPEKMIGTKRTMPEGEDFPVVVFANIMKKYGKKRNEVTQFIMDSGFDGLKDLTSKAREAKKKPLDLLEEMIKNN